jgi:hypothetical protein
MSNEAMNAQLRAAFGRPLPEQQPVEQPIGDTLGRGKPGPALFRRPPTTNALANERIRAAARVVRQASVRGGIAIDLDDPWR